jgi:hypothetical protein
MISLFFFFTAKMLFVSHSKENFDSEIFVIGIFVDLELAIRK